ncbi:complement C1q protein [Bacillus cereus group sp. BfR-BA-01380]|nr:complement C1q protein [Bacillus cereus group sp. BfR-BA-01380]
MNKFLVLLPILLITGMFNFATDNQIESSQDAPKPVIQRMNVDPGGW